MEIANIVIVALVILLGVWFWLKKRQSKNTVMTEPAQASTTAGTQPAHEALPETQNSTAEIIQLSNYSPAAGSEMAGAESAASAKTESQMPSDSLNYVLSPDEAESLASSSAAEKTFNSPVLALVENAAATPISCRHAGIISRIPEDSTLRRHFLCQLKAEFVAQFEPKPTDSTLKRHYETEINSKFEQFLAKNQ